MMMMMMPLSVSRWIFLLTLAVVLFFSATQADFGVDLPCCFSHESTKIHRIKECFEQKPREDCNHHAFLVINRRGRQRCIDPAAQWLQNLIKAGKLNCPLDVTLNTTSAAPEA